MKGLYIIDELDFVRQNKTKRENALTDMLALLLMLKVIEVRDMVGIYVADYIRNHK